MESYVIRHAPTASTVDVDAHEWWGTLDCENVETYTETVSRTKFSSFLLEHLQVWCNDGVYSVIECEGGVSERRKYISAQNRKVLSHYGL